MNNHRPNLPYSELDIANAHRIMGNARSQTPTITTEKHGAEGSITRRTHPLHQSDLVKVLRYEYARLDVLDFITQSPKCHIDVYSYRTPLSRRPGSLLPFRSKELVIDIDGELLLIDPADSRQVMRFTTSDEEDHIHIHDHIDNPVEIHAGDGDDRIIAESWNNDIYAGAGDDDITVSGNGICHVEGGAGNDQISAGGHSHGTFYGGPGDDTIRGGNLTAVILGGEGNDTLIGGDGRNIICAGPGDDRIEAGAGSNVMYTSEGFNQVEKLKTTDTTYHNVKSELTVDCTKITREQMDTFPPGQIASHAIQLEPKPLDLSAFVIKGSPFFIGRAKDDLYLLNASPTGQRLLTVLERAFTTSGKPITINELTPIANGEFVPEDKAAADQAFIENQHAGRPAYGGDIWYSARNMRFGTPSVITLFHELCHAYNHVTGTKLRGTSRDGADQHYPRGQIPNAELQAVGLPTETEPFDFDGDPSTPPTTTNPETFSENGLRKELGWPLRNQYGNN